MDDEFSMAQTAAEQQRKESSGLTEETLIYVLHVDDDDDFLTMSKRFLEKQGTFQIETALSVKEALEKLGKKSFDVIVSDYQMPRKSGLEFLKELRTSGNDVAFFLFTGAIKEEVAIEAFNLGANRVFNKNGNYELVYLELAHAIKELVKSKRVQKRLTDAEEQLKQIVEHAPEAIYVTDDKGRVIDGNKQAEALTGYKREEFVGKSLLELNLFPEEYVPLVRAGIQANIRGEKTGPTEGELMKKDGSRIFIENSSIPIKGRNGIEIIGIARDITDRKVAEEKIRSLAKFPSESPNPVLRVTKNGKILYVNKAAQNHGCNHKEVPETLKKAVSSSLGSGFPEEVEVECGNQTFSFIVAPIPETGYANIYGRNVTEAKAAWDSLEETMNELVMINEKLGVVGKLTRHDGRNKLAVILNNLYLAEQKLKTNRDASVHLNGIGSAVEKLEKIFDFAGTYEMLGAEELSYTDVTKSANEAVSLFSDLNGTKIVNDCQGLIVLADSLLRQLFYNLIHNSLRYGEKLTQIRIHCKETEKSQLMLVYEDNGVGIPDDEKQKIFENGYGKGTGYGLYLIMKLCEAYGWTIQETGVPCKGARFVMTIPKTNKNGKLSYRFESNIEDS